MSIHTQLVLRGVDVTTGQDLATSYSNATRTIMTWKNINLRNVLGNLYDKYDTFNLSLSFVSADHPTTSYVNGNVATFGAGDSTNLINNIYISGLPFINSTYQQSLSHNGISAFVGCFTYASQNAIANNFNVETSVMWQQYNSTTTITFGKNQEQADITISLLRAADFTPPVNPFAFPATNFVFDIIGCDLKKENASRLDMR